MVFAALLIGLLMVFFMEKIIAVFFALFSREDGEINPFLAFLALTSPLWVIFLLAAIKGYK